MGCALGSISLFHHYNLVCYIHTYGQNVITAMFAFQIGIREGTAWDKSNFICIILKQ